MGQRKGSLGSGTYALPGGHLDFGESFEQCAAREVKEECGLDITDLRFLTATNSVFRDTDRHYVTIFMVASAAAGSDGLPAEPQLLEPDKCESWSWQTFHQMREMPARGKALFQPLHSLMEQRPDVCAYLEAHTSPTGG
ncbi:hypothetical protein LTR53_001568 [Teratosphaeriaceae sp. CCFEE 6253]|nr:hypothetical protein LTR53_001568 [Teratosphaeriaceae sp. CCFEE 6253]